jgi:hypothetical protein
MTKTIIMGMKVGLRITYTSQSNRGTRGDSVPKVNSADIIERARRFVTGSASFEALGCEPT